VTRPRIAFCTTCKGRLPHLAKTLPRNVADNPHAEFVILSYGCKETADWVKVAALPRVTLYETHFEFFRMAHAKNMAHRCAILQGADILVNMDADNFTGPGFDEWLLDNMHGRVFAWARMIPGVLKRGISGRIAISKEGFELAGGYDESKFNTWGPDDKDFNARLVCLDYKPIEIPAQYLGAIRHHDRMRFREYPEARKNCYDDYVPPCDGRSVVNDGHVGDGLVRKLDDDFHLFGPIPTKVFGIGLHKTGTSSLAAALTMLGFPCAHWHNPGWARQVWGNPKALEPWRAACDIPVALMYRELDQYYPGSKFILTLREKYSWLESVERHFSHGNKYWGSWKKDRITNRLHTSIYGRHDFDLRDMWAGYERHTEAVLNYFKGRSDLYVMERPSWQFASFLGCEIPDVPYPHVNPYA
jgi:hypothetical protein